LHITLSRFFDEQGKPANKFLRNVQQMKSFIMKTFIILGVVLTLWLVFAQSCLSFRMSDEAAKRKFDAKGVPVAFNTITVNNRHLHYLQTGRDTLPTIVFVHGTPGSWDAFEIYLQDSALLQKFRLISIDRPGFGHSDFGKPQNLAQQSVTISPLFNEINNGKPVWLVGHSLGSPMIIKLAADNPGRIAGLVLLAGSNDPAQETPEKWRPVLYKSPLTFLVPGALRPSNEELWYLKKDLLYLKDDFTKITCPVYIVHGMKDNMVPFENVAYDKKMLVHTSKVEELIFPDANHFIPWTRFGPIKKLLLNLY
jgi:pimeloyl-ACP methyl ester carboxylesterase